MRTIALIRCVEVGASELALRDRLAGWFGDDVWFVADNSAGKAGWPEAEAGRVVEMTREKLKGMGLRVFHRSGWQCGDYCYYAAKAEIAGWDFAWLIEPDVGFSFADIGEFFGRFVEDTTDLLAVGLGRRRGKWGWHKAAAQFVGGDNVFGVYFPLTRLSNRAVRVLATRRAVELASLPQEVERLLIPNDEAFVASSVMALGYSAAKLSDHFPAGTFDLFSTAFPVMPEELDLAENANCVAHPVREAPLATDKMKRLAPHRVAQIRSRILHSLGADAWVEWSGLSAGDEDAETTAAPAEI